MTVSLKALPPVEAIEYFRSKGLAPHDGRFDWRDTWREQHAAEFVVAKGMSDDILNMIRADILKAMEEGRGFSGWSKDLPARLKAAGWWGQQTMTDPLSGETKLVQLGSMHRLRTIFDTNMRIALAVGRWAQIQRSKKFFPYLGYRQIDRPTKRPAHARFDGLVRPVDDPIWFRIFPPNGFYCGCTVFQITARQIRNGEYQVSDPIDLEELGWLNERSGEEEEIARGIHPGFDVNPGVVWLDTRESLDELAGPKNHPEMVGILTQLRLDVMRDRETRAMALDDEGAAVWTSDRPTPAPPGSDVVMVSPQPDAAVSRDDLAEMGREGQQSVTVMTTDGSLSSARLIPEAAPRMAPVLNVVIARLREPSNALYLVALGEMERAVVENEIAAGFAAGQGVIDYLSRPNAARADVLARHADFIARIIAGE